MGDLSRRAIEPYRTIANPLSHNGGREKSGKSGAQAALESARRLATLQEAPPISRHGFLEGKRRRAPEVVGGLAGGRTVNRLSCPAPLRRGLLLRPM